MCALVCVFVVCCVCHAFRLLLPCACQTSVSLSCLTALRSRYSPHHCKVPRTLSTSLSPPLFICLSFSVSLMFSILATLPPSAGSATTTTTEITAESRFFPNRKPFVLSSASATTNDINNSSISGSRSIGRSALSGSRELMDGRIPVARLRLESVELEERLVLSSAATTTATTAIPATAAIPSSPISPRASATVISPPPPLPAPPPVTATAALDGHWRSLDGPLEVHGLLELDRAVWLPFLVQQCGAQSSSSSSAFSSSYYSSSSRSAAAGAVAATTTSTLYESLAVEVRCRLRVTFRYHPNAVEDLPYLVGPVETVLVEERQCLWTFPARNPYANDPLVPETLLSRWRSKLSSPSSSSSSPSSSSSYAELELPPTTREQVARQADPLMDMSSGATFTSTTATSTATPTTTPYSLPFVFRLPRFLPNSTRFEFYDPATGEPLATPALQSGHRHPQQQQQQAAGIHFQLEVECVQVVDRRRSTTLFRTVVPLLKRSRFVESSSSQPPPPLSEAFQPFDTGRPPFAFPHAASSSSVSSSVSPSASPDQISIAMPEHQDSARWSRFPPPPPIATTANTMSTTNASPSWGDPRLTYRCQYHPFSVVGLMHFLRRTHPITTTIHVSQPFFYQEEAIAVRVLVENRSSGESIVGVRCLVRQVLDVYYDAAAAVADGGGDNNSSSSSSRQRPPLLHETFRTTVSRRTVTNKYLVMQRRFESSSSFRYFPLEPGDTGDYVVHLPEPRDSHREARSMTGVTTVGTTAGTTTTMMRTTTTTKRRPRWEEPMLFRTNPFEEEPDERWDEARPLLAPSTVLTHNGSSSPSSSYHLGRRRPSSSWGSLFRRSGSWSSLQSSSSSSSSSLSPPSQQQQQQQQHVQRTSSQQRSSSMISLQNINTVDRFSPIQVSYELEVWACCGGSWVMVADRVPIVLLGRRDHR